MARKTDQDFQERNQLRRIIAGLSEGVVLVEPDGTIRWANEAALAMHACSSLDDFATTADAYVERFILHDNNHQRLTANDYPIARLLAGDDFSGLIIEVAQNSEADESRILEVSTPVARIGAEKPEFMVLMLRDITQRLDAEDRFERSFATNPAPALVLCLEDSRYIKANQGFLDMTGYAENEVIGQPMRRLDVLHDAQYRDTAIHALEEHATIAQQESTIRCRDGHDKLVILAGQPIHMLDEACMLFTFNDLDERKQAELALHENQELFSTLFNMAPIPMLVCLRQGWRILEANNTFARDIGHTRADVLHQHVARAGLPNGRETLRDLESELVESQNVVKRALQWHTRDDATLETLLYAAPVTIRDEACVLLVLLDITERKRSEADLMAAIEAVMQDASWFSHTLMEKLAQIRTPNHADEGLDSLTQREHDVLECLCEGLNNAEIATALHLSKNTVRNHLANLYDKIGVNRRSAAVVWGRDRGLGGYY